LLCCLTNQATKVGIPFLLRTEALCLGLKYIYLRAAEKLKTELLNYTQLKDSSAAKRHRNDIYVMGS
jgi:hypothetical protein